LLPEAVQRHVREGSITAQIAMNLKTAVKSEASAGSS